MKLEIPDELNKFFPSGDFDTIPYAPELKEILTDKILGYLKLKGAIKKGTSSEALYRDLADKIKERWKDSPSIKQGKEYPVEWSYLRNIVHPSGGSKWRKSINKSMVLLIYHSLTDFLLEEESKILTENEKNNARFKELVARLRSGSKRYLGELEQSGMFTARYEAILPKLLDENGGIIEDDVPLQRIIKNSWIEKTADNLIILGEGGAGKSTTLVHLWDLLLKAQSGPIPIYIPLNEKEIWLDQKEFIFSYIVRNYLNVYEVSITEKNELWDLLQTGKNGGLPKLLLLLDGLNEITHKRSEFYNELSHWAQKMTACQFVITSRTDQRQTHSCFNGFQLIRVQPLGDNQVTGYLNACDIQTDHLKLPKGILSNPLMLSLFARTYKYDSNGFINLKLPATSPSDIFWNYLQIQLSKFREKNEEFYRVKFLLFHYLPRLAYAMFIYDKQVITKFELETYIVECSREFISNNFREIFTEYADSYHTFGLEFPAQVQSVEFRKLFCNSLAILLDNNGIRFFHHNIRNFLASLHIINALSCFMKVRYKKSNLCSFPAEVKEAFWPMPLRRYIWDICSTTDQESLLLDALENSRNIFEEEHTGLTNINLINILKENLPEFAVNLSYLNLLNVNLNNINFSKKNVGIATSFEGSLIHESSFLPLGNVGTVWCLCYSPDNKFLVTGSVDGNISVWNLNSEILSNSFVHDRAVFRVVHHPILDKFLTLDDEGWIHEWDLINGQNTLKIKTVHSIDPWDLKWLGYSNDGKTAVIYSFLDDKSEIFDLFTGATIHTDFEFDEYIFPSVSFNETSFFVALRGVKGSDANNYLSIYDAIDNQTFASFKLDTDIFSGAISCDMKRVAASYGTGIIEWNLETFEVINHFQTDSTWISSGAYSPSGQKVITSAGGYIQEWDVQTGINIQSFKASEAFIFSINYHPNEKEIVSLEGGGVVKKWDLDKQQCTFESTVENAENAFFSSNGELIIEKIKNDTSINFIYETKEEVVVKPPAYKSLPEIIFNEKQDVIISVGGVSLNEFVNNVSEINLTFKDAFDSLLFFSVSPCKTKVATGYIGNVFAEWDVMTGKLLKKYTYIFGLHLWGCSFQNLHKNSIITDKFKHYLRMYGAQV